MRRTNSALPVARIVLLRSAAVLAILIVVARLFQVSVLEHAGAIASAKNQYGIKQIIQANRGKIYFKNLNGGDDYPVALNQDSYTLIVDPKLINDTPKTAAALAPLLGMSIDDVLNKIKDKTKRYIVLKKLIPKDISKQIDELGLKGLTIQIDPSRFYPEGSLGSHVIGFVNGSGEGQYGVEGFFNEDLKGYDGSFIGEKDAKRRIIEEQDSAQPRDGTSLVLTIDQNLQYTVEQKLQDAIKQYEADSGSAVVMDIKTGAILALANKPDFDLNKYSDVSADQQSVFTDTAVSDTWEPGSIFKAFTLAAGMDMGLFEPDTTMDLPCSIRVNGFDIRNAEDKCYPHSNITDILTQSINIGTSWAADKLGNENFSHYISAFGFGSKTGIELQPEATGKVLNFKQWQDVNRATMSFGQGLTVTPIQIVAAYAAIANGGKLMKPYLVASRINSDGKEINTVPREVSQPIKPETATKATYLLEKVVTDGHGKKAAVPGYVIAGKTGTAQVVGKDGKYEENSHIGSFAGFFPADQPRFALVVKLDRPKAVEFAESSAAPTFGEIAQWLLHYAKIPPSS